VISLSATERPGHIPSLIAFDDNDGIYRRRLGQAVLLGLELLVPADIIGTVAVEPTLRSVAVLGLIVLVRTFLSMALEVEMDGRLPWRRHDAAARARPHS
jgi:Protein of unknown function (DUF1622)